VSLALPVRRVLPVAQVLLPPLNPFCPPMALEFQKQVAQVALRLSLPRQRPQQQAEHCQQRAERRSSWL
jgi:hypothetical protein